MTPDPWLIAAILYVIPAASLLWFFHKVRHSSFGWQERSVTTLGAVLWPLLPVALVGFFIWEIVSDLRRKRYR